MGPITVVSNGSNVNNAQSTQILLNSKYSFTKLDTSNIVSFQTISLLFDHEPPQTANSAGAYTQTLLYQFPHGYNYIPSIWLMWQNDSPTSPPAPPPSGTATTFYAFGDDTSSEAAIDLLTSSGTPINDGTLLAYVIYNNSGSPVDTTFSWLTVQVDATNVYIYVFKYSFDTIGGNTIPIYLAGTTLDIRCYVFTEPGTTSIY